MTPSQAAEGVDYILAELSRRRFAPRYFKTDREHPYERSESEVRQHCDYGAEGSHYTVVEPDDALGFVIKVGGISTPRPWVIDELMQMIKRDHAIYDATADLLRRLSTQNTEGWRSIESAPRDGTRVILGWDSGRPSRYGHYLDNSSTKAPWKGWRAPSMETPLPPADPTHWMPLPAPPTLASRDVP